VGEYHPASIRITSANKEKSKMQSFIRLRDLRDRKRGGANSGIKETKKRGKRAEGREEFAEGNY